MWLALDIGTKRTGVATSSSGLLATPWGVIEGLVDEQISRLLDILRAQEISTIVIGVPRLNRERDQFPPHIDTFVQKLRQSLAQHPIKLVFVDETLSTKEVERRLGHPARKSDTTDAAAAQLILEDYLAEHAHDIN